MVRRFVVSIRGAARGLGPLIDQTLGHLAAQLEPSELRWEDRTGAAHRRTLRPGPIALPARGRRLQVQLRRPGGNRPIASLRAWPAGCGDVPRSLRSHHLQLELRLRMGAAAADAQHADGAGSAGGRSPLALAVFCADALLRLPLVRLWEGEGRGQGMVDEGGRFVVAYENLQTLLDLTVELHNSHYVPSSSGPKLVDRTHRITNRRKALALLQEHLPLLLAYGGAGFVSHPLPEGGIALCRVSDAKDRGWVAADFAPPLPYGTTTRLAPGALFLPPGGFLLASLAALGLAFGPDIPLASLSPPLARALQTDSAFQRYHVLS